MMSFRYNLYIFIPVFIYTFICSCIYPFIPVFIYALEMKDFFFVCQNIRKKVFNKLYDDKGGESLKFWDLSHWKFNRHNRFAQM